MFNLNLSKITTPLSQFVARQLAHPSGWFGRAIVTRLLDRGNRELIESTLGFLTLTDKTRLLDVGFGGGLALRLARGRGVAALFGVDRSIVAVEKLRASASKWVHGGVVTAIEGAVESLPFDENSFDAVMSTNTVYFWPDLTAAFKELHRVMATPGRLAIGFASSSKLRSMNAITQHGFLFYENGELLEHAKTGGFSDVRIEALHGRTTEGSYVLVAERT